MQAKQCAQSPAEENEKALRSLEEDKQKVLKRKVPGLGFGGLYISTPNKP